MSGCCELIKTKRVMCEEEFTLEESYEFCTMRIPTTQPFNTTDPIIVEGTSNILCTGCELSIDPDTCTLSVTITGFLLDETLTLTQGAVTETVDIPVARICDTITVDLNKCKMTDSCKENLECQVFNLTATNEVIATYDDTTSELVIDQTVSDINFTVKIDQETQLLVQICSKTGGSVTINP